MEPTKELADTLYLDKVRRARAMSLEDKLFEDIRLFDLARGMAIAGIQADFPNATNEEVRAILAERLRLIRRLENQRVG